MNKFQVFTIAHHRLESYLRKLYGKDAFVSDKARKVLQNYLEKGGNPEKQLFRFLIVCDEQEEKLLQPKPTPPGTPEDTTAINLINLTKEFPLHQEEFPES